VVRDLLNFYRNIKNKFNNTILYLYITIIIRILIKWFKNWAGLRFYPDARDFTIYVLTQIVQIIKAGKL
jgi:hypothetical protein